MAGTFRALAGWVDLECALRIRGRSRRAHLAGRHHGGFWAPDGAYSRFVSPIIGLACVVVVSRVLLTQKSCCACWMVMPTLACNFES